jgi:hypothetical protein
MENTSGRKRESGKTVARDAVLAPLLATRFKRAPTVSLFAGIT